VSKPALWDCSILQSRHMLSKTLKADVKVYMLPNCTA
jgi:hypothetical protein